jgi:TatD DNase family protein
LPDICQALAEIMNVTPERLAQASTANACELFGWS